MISPVCLFICIILLVSKVVFLIKFDDVDNPVRKRIVNIYWISTDVVVVLIIIINYIVRWNK